MAKRRKQPRSLPKRILGVRVPKTLRRAADTQLGSAIMAQLIMAGGRTALQSEQALRLRDNAQAMMNSFAASVSQAAQAANRPALDDQEDRPSPVRRGRRNQDGELDDRPH